MPGLSRSDRYIGCLLGTAVGDSLLLPAEGLSRTAIARRFPGPLRHGLIAGRGMCSDDTEHTFLTAQALLAGGDDPDRFARELAWRLRWWLACVPAGCGLATARGILRLWIGVPPARSGVMSAGNGPAMRSALIGLRWADDPVRMRSFVTASSQITHRDPRAIGAALAVAATTAWIATAGSDDLVSIWRACCRDPGWNQAMDVIDRRLRSGDPVDAVAADLGCPSYVSGFCLHSVPVAMYAWMRHRGDPVGCMTAVHRCGGDTDTMGAIAGALQGADGGVAAFPAAWIDRIWEWPMSTARLGQAGQALAEGSVRAVPWCWPLVPLRNLGFLLVILGHIVRRALPSFSRS